MTKGYIQKYKGKRKTSYRVSVPLGWNSETGKYEYYKATFDTEKEARETVKNLLSQTKKKRAKHVDKLTLQEFMFKWLDAKKSSLAPLTLEGYQIIIDKHLIPALGQIRVADLTPKHIQDYYLRAMKRGRKDGKPGGLSPLTVTHHHRLLKEILDQAVGWRVLKYNPADTVVPPTREIVKNPTANRSVLTMEQLRTVIDAVKGTYLYLPVFIAAFTGMRRAEVLGLTWENVDLDRGILYVVQTLFQRKKDIWYFQPTKNNKSRRSIELYDFTVETLKQHQPPEPKGLVCRNEKGGHINPGTLGSRYIVVTKQLGLNTNFHALRHTHATHLLQMGVPPKIVSERLGHSTTRTTEDIYAHVLPGIQRGAAKLFEEAFLGSDIQSL